ncbi:DUF1992 domain-containing protein [uncultured Arthrobacter sp.]|uniref:DnaJ family domain-containing protein n=1 Tax=uncultured Arthrobacter sp. TaxID=114050 RepID=UPI0026198C13|nr:DUF1992 domain-containing protein [uncultured Arthrobacter sp.]
MNERSERARRMQRASEYRAARRSGSSGAEAIEQVDDDEEQAPITDFAAKADFEIRQATARGDFDNLKYAGKPIPGLGTTLDPDWWVKGLIEREQLSGLAPAPFRLRKEDAELDDKLDQQYMESRARELLEDFNRQVVDARRQLLGGPPVITNTRDIEHELERWRERRAARTAQAAEESAQQEEAKRSPWWRRRR